MTTQTIVNISILNAWIKANSPDGVMRLALQSGVSTSKIVRIRMGAVPVSMDDRKALAKALKVDVSVLFPEVKIRESAS